jgi:hypothetical protein
MFLGLNDKNHDGEIALNEFDDKQRDFMRALDRNRDGKVAKDDWDVLAATTAKSENVMIAVKPGGQGDITATHVLWKATRGLPYVPSPLLLRRPRLSREDGGIDVLFRREDRQAFLCARTPRSDRELLRVTDRRRTAESTVGFVVRQTHRHQAGGDKPEILHQADFGERIFATPAPIGERLYLADAGHLWAFGK